MGLISGPNKKHSLFESTTEQRIVFFLVFMGVLSITFCLLYIVDFLPEEPTNVAEIETQESGDEIDLMPASGEEIRDSEGLAQGETLEYSEHGAATLNNQLYVEVDQYPILITFDALDGKEVNVLNPVSSGVADLDHALLSGVVRHPNSADFVNEGTIFLFGHSSYLPNVINKNFQAFNGIQKLEWGDKIRLQSSDTEYVYRVDRVYQAKASDAEVEIADGEPKLVLATCNSFGSKDDRFVVEATLVSQSRL